MTVSIALCTYNGERYLAEQLESILSQTRLPDEIVVRDDRSSDRTMEILKEYNDKYPDIFDVKKNNHNIGVRENFERTINACSGKFIALSDQDDLWSETKIEKQVNALTDSNAALVCHNSSLITEVGEEIGDLWSNLPRPFYLSEDIDNTDAMIELIRRNFVQGATTMIERSRLQELLPISENWGKDHYLGVQATLKTGVEILPEKLIAYRQHSDQVVGGPKSGLTPKIRNLVTGGLVGSKLQKWREIEQWVESHNNDQMVPNKSDIEPILSERIEYECRRSKVVNDENILQGSKYVLNNFIDGKYKKFDTGSQKIVNDILLLILK